MYFRFLDGKRNGERDKDEEGGLTGIYCRCCQGEDMKRDETEERDKYEGMCHCTRMRSVAYMS